MIQVNNSFYVSGITMLNNDTTINSSLLVSGNTIIKNSFNIKIFKNI